MFEKLKVRLEGYRGNLAFSQEWHNIARGLSLYTPDYPLLEMRRYHFVFLSDECMSMYEQHSVVDGLNVYPCHTKDLYVMLRKELGKASRPVVFDPANLSDGPVLRRIKDCPKAQVQGQLFLLAPYVLAELDLYKQNTLQFHRREVRVEVPFQQLIKQRYAKPWRVRTTEVVTAWAYFADQEYYYDVSNRGRFKDDLLKFREHNLNYIPRYHFTPDDF